MKLSAGSRTSFGTTIRSDTYSFFRPEFYLESLIDSMKLLVQRFPRLGLIVMGSDAGSEEIAEQIRSLGLQDNVLLAGDLPHDEFLSLLTRTRMYIRTPSKDGVCSSVLEALSLSVPVVASENGSRPAGVVTFTPNDAEDLAAKVGDVLGAYDDVRRRIPRPEILTPFLTKPAVERTPNAVLHEILYHHRTLGDGAEVSTSPR